VSVFNSDGTKLAETAGIANPYYITFDFLGNAWVTSFTSNLVAKISLAGSTLTIQGTYPMVGNPFAIATNPKDGNIWVTNDASSTVTVIAP
jgi:DNA-binding beta-propeller fold protein YncE